MSSTQRIWAALAALVALLAPESLHADDLEDLFRLEKEFNTHHVAGHYRAAEPIARQMLVIAERSFQEKPAVIAVCLNNLANLYRDQGRYAEAEPLYKRALAIRE